MKRKYAIFLLLFLAMLYTAPLAADIVHSGSGVACAAGQAENQQQMEPVEREKDYYTIFPEERWPLMMFIYNSISGVVAGLLVITIVISGYRYMAASANPGIKASFSEDLQRCVIAMTIIALAPLFIKILIGVNDSFVSFFAHIVNASTAEAVLENKSSLSPAGMFEKIIALIFQGITNLFKYVLGLNSVDTLIFNGQVELLKSTTNFQTGNVFTDSILNLAMVGFMVYFNALYTIRKYVVIAFFVAIPIFAGLWGFSGNKRIYEIPLAEIIQTIFVQSAHALTMGVFIMVLFGRETAIVDATQINQGLIHVAMWVAGLGGAICTLIMVKLGFKIVTATGDNDIAEAKSGFGKAMVGLGILGSAMLIAGYIFQLTSGKWY
ncbi:pilin [Pelotomaculum propionicicum]|uniref:pilin n=1 Tax=Pelotomaculum propionicicum TaxID=258475 RepID=UPI003B7FB3BB